MKKIQPKEDVDNISTEQAVSDFKTKEQQENQAFQHMLLWLAAAAIVEVVVLLLNRFYLNMRVSELPIALTLHRMLAWFLPVGIVLFAAFLFWGIRVRRKHPNKTGIGQILGAAIFLCVGVCGFLMRRFGEGSGTVLLAIVPGLAVLMMIYYLYHKEFFGCGIVGALGILGLWIVRNGGSVYRGYLIFTLIVMIAGMALALVLKRGDGALTVGDRRIALLLPDAAYMTFFVTCILTAVLLLIPLFVGAAAAYYSIWILAAWLFILAVYFTAKLM